MLTSGGQTACRILSRQLFPVRAIVAGRWLKTVDDSAKTKHLSKAAAGPLALEAGVPLHSGLQSRILP
jgi:hypothetical protein